MHEVVLADGWHVLRRDGVIGVLVLSKLVMRGNGRRSGGGADVNEVELVEHELHELDGLQGPQRVEVAPAAVEGVAIGFQFEEEFFVGLDGADVKAVEFVGVATVFDAEMEIGDGFWGVWG